MLFKEIIAVYSENCMKPITIITELLIFKANGTYKLPLGFKGLTSIVNS
jgi:hypothetical protein